MRDYSTVASTFWTGDTGILLREAGRDAQNVALYLITGPNSNMIGIYNLPLPLLCHHNGMTNKEACKALQRVVDAQFCLWDAPSEVVFVNMMARHQVGETLQTNDNRHKGVIRELMRWRKTPFIRPFYGIYGECYNLPPIEQIEAQHKPLQRGGDTKPLRSQEHEQDHDQEQEQDHEQDHLLAANRGGAVEAFNELVERWNAIEGVTACRAKSASRLAAFKSRSKDVFWVVNVQDALDRLGQSSFCKGGGSTGWRADLDWFLKPDSVARIVEGKYDDRNGTANAGVFQGMEGFLARGDKNDAT